jgi:hypothetical protein
MNPTQRAYPSECTRRNEEQRSDAQGMIEPKMPTFFSVDMNPFCARSSSGVFGIGIASGARARPARGAYHHLPVACLRARSMHRCRKSANLMIRIAVSSPLVVIAASLVALCSWPDHGMSMDAHS